MLSIDSINNGLVIDHIRAGSSMEIYQHLNLAELDSSVAIIKNVKSKKMGKKDIIKIEDRTDIDYDVLGFIDPNITVNIIVNGEIHDKVNLSLPEKVENIISCKNPRCVTSIEPEIPHVFRLVDAAEQRYRCMYCEQEDRRHR